MINTTARHRIHWTKSYHAAPTHIQTLQEWIRELQEQGPEGIVIAVAGNKSDKCESPGDAHLREVEAAEAQAYAAEIGASFLETSAKTRTNVNEIFETISRSLPAYEPPQNYQNTLKLQAGKHQQSSCC